MGQPFGVLIIYRWPQNCFRWPGIPHMTLRPMLEERAAGLAMPSTRSILAVNLVGARAATLRWDKLNDCTGVWEGKISSCRALQFLAEF